MSYVGSPTIYEYVFIIRKIGRIFLSHCLCGVVYLGKKHTKGDEISLSI